MRITDAPEKGEIEKLVAGLRRRADTMNTGSHVGPDNSAGKLGYYSASDARFDRETADALTALSARLAEAERVIEPFAAEAEMWVEMGDTRPIYSLPPLDGGGPTVGDLRPGADAWICKICDGGPANHGTCACPNGPVKEYPFASGTDGEARVVAWLHSIREPDGEVSELFSRSPDNPWSHWLERHRDECEYVCKPLYYASRPRQKEINNEEL